MSFELTEQVPAYIDRDKMPFDEGEYVGFITIKGAGFETIRAENFATTLRRHSIAFTKVYDRKFRFDFQFYFKHEHELTAARLLL